ncbi:hypothetical protein AB0J68_10345 [Micromonospora sp. NPDC049580]|uniref:hypothetical protein n=1 Tax=Micromonospora sp. NPDC049580 TaxID=3154832 RepID=UPI0034495E84
MAGVLRAGRRDDGLGRVAVGKVVLVQLFFLLKFCQLPVLQHLFREPDDGFGACVDTEAGLRSAPPNGTVVAYVDLTYIPGGYGHERVVPGGLRVVVGRVAALDLLFKAVEGAGAEVPSSFGLFDPPGKEGCLSVEPSVQAWVVGPLRVVNVAHGR